MSQIRAPFDSKIIFIKQRQNHNPRGGVNRLLARSSRMVVPLLTTTSTRSPPFTWSYVSGKACKSSSRPSLARRPVHGRTAASSTSFPLEEPSRDKSLPRTTSLRLARQVQAPTSTWARAHYSGGATDARGGANLHVTRKQQLAAMQAARPGKSLNADKLCGHHIAIISYSVTRKTQPEALKHPLRRAQA
jgi:hypothetical protein